MSPGHSEIMSPGVPTSCRLVERRPAGGWFLPSSGVLVNPLRLISVGFAAGRWNPAIAIAYGAPRAIWESAADMAATVHYAVDRSGFRRHTRPSPTRAAPHSSLEVSVPVPAPNRRALQRGCHLCSDTALSGWDRQFESAFLQRGVCELSVPQRPLISGSRSCPSLLGSRRILGAFRPNNAPIVGRIPASFVACGRRRLSSALRECSR
jgi:hypothetical protein